MSEDYSDNLGLCRSWLWDMDKDKTPIPPFCLELFLRDGRSYYVQCLLGKDEKSKAMVFSIWDLRSFTASEIEDFKLNLKNYSRDKLRSFQDVHPKLDRAHLWVHLDDIWYWVEWHDKVWPSDSLKILGFGQ